MYPPVVKRTFNYFWVIFFGIGKFGYITCTFGNKLCSIGLAGTCEYGKEPSGSIKCGEFLG
jgi:hypothetical protein